MIKGDPEKINVVVANLIPPATRVSLYIDNPSSELIGVLVAETDQVSVSSETSALTYAEHFTCVTSFTATVVLAGSSANTTSTAVQ